MVVDNKTLFPRWHWAGVHESPQIFSPLKLEMIRLDMIRYPKMMSYLKLERYLEPKALFFAIYMCNFFGVLLVLYYKNQLHVWQYKSQIDPMEW